MTNAIQEYHAIKNSIESLGMYIAWKKFGSHDMRPNLGQTWFRLTDTIAVVVRMESK